jgi:hypothetical protein
MYEKFKNLKPIKDPKVRRELRSLLLKRKELLEKREVERDKQIKEQDKKHNKYLPKYLSAKILNAIGFIEYTKLKGNVDMSSISKFLMEEKKLTKKEMGWVLLLLSLEAVEEILATPEVSDMIKEAVYKNRKTLH